MGLWSMGRWSVDLIKLVFNTLIYVTSFANISILKLNCRKTHTELLTLSISQVQVVQVIFCSHTRPGRPASNICFLQFCWRRGVGKGFFYQRIQCFRFLRLPFHVEVSICYPFFRVFLSFTICSNNANFKVVQTCTLMKGNVFRIYREKFFSTKH